MSILLKEKARVILTSIVAIILGILFCAIPGKSLDALEMFVAGVLIFVGVVYVLGFCFAPEFSKEASILIIGMVAIALGILVLFIPSSLVLGIGLIAGLTGLKRLGLAIDAKYLGDKNWWIDLIFGLGVFILGMLLIIFRCTSIAVNAVMIYMGATLIVFGIMNLVLIFALKREVTKFKKLFKSYIDKNEEISGEAEDTDNSTDNFTDFEVK